jgi:CubicO group peptidase (beta-lactamase class C family)
MKRTWLAAMFTAVCIFPALGQTAPTKATEDECETLWKDFDQDDDDILSEAEVARLKAVLAIIDTNKDGLVGKDEFIAACRKGVLKGMKK